MAWDNDEDYAYTKDNDIAQWSWEFIRRNLKYIKEREEKLAEFRAGNSPNQEIINSIARFNETCPKNAKSDTGYNPNYSDATKDDFRIVLEKNDWGLLNYYNPKIAKPDTAMFHPTSNLCYLVDPNIHRIEFPSLGANSMVCIVNFDYPVNPQFAFIKKRAKEFQNRNQQPRKTLIKIKYKLWTLYIRILDAKDDKAKSKEIQTQFFSNKAQGADTSYKETLKQAKNMVKEGYKNLVLSAQLRC